jgi:hypothetical protein
MARVLRYATVTITYSLQCGFERATALADDMAEILKDDPGFHSASDDTRGWDIWAQIDVIYTSLEHAIRLDPRVRELLGRRANYTYEADSHISYGQRGPTSYVTAHTTLEPIEPKGP